MRLLTLAYVIAKFTLTVSPEQVLTPPTTAVMTPQAVQDGRFSRDGLAYFGQVPPARERPPGTPRDYKLWSVATGKVTAEWSRDMVPDLIEPHLADGKDWAVHTFIPPNFNSRYHWVDLATGKLTQLPGIDRPELSATPPSYSADRRRMAYRVYAGTDAPASVHVYERRESGWAKVAEVPGEKGALSPDGTRVAALVKSDGLMVRLTRVADGRELWKTPVDSYGLNSFTPDGRFVIQADNGGYRVLDAATGTQKLLVTNSDRPNSGKPTAIAYNAGFVAAVVRTEEATELVRYDADAGKEVSRTPVEAVQFTDRTPPFAAPRLLTAHTRQSHRPSLFNRSTFSTMRVDVFDPARPTPIARLTVPAPDSLTLAPDGRTLAVVNYRFLQFYTLPGGE